MAEAAQQIGIHPGAVREAITRGRIDAIRVGGGEKRAGLLLIHRDEINRYINEVRGTHGPKPKPTDA
ncbi:MAG: helix-turn-helix domain-containing protein [Chloroflexota bacterium]|nr:helix-turn-helix domain-containing protein [Chloroflexota bacterium]